MKNLKCTVSYDGTNYHGFQRQENALAVQEVIETPADLGFFSHAMPQR